MTSSYYEYIKNYMEQTEYFTKYKGSLTMLYKTT